MGARTPLFRERILLVLQYTATKEMKKAKYHDIRRDDISELVSLSGCKNLNDMIARDRECEIDLEYLGKRKSGQIQIPVGQEKRLKT